MRGPTIGRRFRLVDRDPARTNEPGTCLYCGAKLRKPRASKLGELGDRGDYADNAFCGLRCGYSFGVAFAAAGHRLEAHR